MTDPSLFILAVLTILGTPGPTNTLLAASGAMVGVRRSLPLLAGELGGYLLAIAAIRAVLGPVIEASPPVGVALKIAVVMYLGWIAFRLWTQDAAPAGRRTVDAKAVFVTTLLNPKAVIFALGVIPAEHPALAWYFAAFAVAVPSAGLGWILLGHAIGTARASGTRERSAASPRMAADNAELQRQHEPRDELFRAPPHGEVGAPFVVVEVEAEAGGEVGGFGVEGHEGLVGGGDERGVEGLELEPGGADGGDGLELAAAAAREVA